MNWPYYKIQDVTKLCNSFGNFLKQYLYKWELYCKLLSRPGETSHILVVSARDSIQSYIKKGETTMKLSKQINKNQKIIYQEELDAPE